jgi:excisionase family DNA binding protein
MEEFLTVEELATHLRLTKAAVWNACKQGRLPAIKMPGSKRWLISRKALEQLQRKQRRSYEAS